MLLTQTITLEMSKMHPRLRPVRAIRLLKRAFTRSAYQIRRTLHKQQPLPCLRGVAATQPQPLPPTKKSQFSDQECGHNLARLTVHFLTKFLELNQHIAPVYDLREANQPVRAWGPHTFSYLLISSTTSLLVHSRSSLSSARRPSSLDFIPLVPLPRRTSSDEPESSPSDGLARSSLPISSISAWAAS